MDTSIDIFKSQIGISVFYTYEICSLSKTTHIHKEKNWHVFFLNLRIVFSGYTGTRFIRLFLVRARRKYIHF